MFGIGTGELLLLMLVALLVLGPERMPKMARDLGKTINDLRRTSDELRSEFLEADRALTAERLLDVAAQQAAAQPQPAALADGGATQAEAAFAPVDTTAPAPSPPVEPDETAFDKEARLARERLEDPSTAARREERAQAEGWTVPDDEAGTSDRTS